MDHLARISKYDRKLIRINFAITLPDKKTEICFNSLYGVICIYIPVGDLFPAYP